MSRFFSGETTKTLSEFTGEKNKNPCVKKSFFVSLTMFTLEVIAKVFKNQYFYPNEINYDSPGLSPMEKIKIRPNINTASNLINLSFRDRFHGFNFTQHVVLGYHKLSFRYTFAIISLFFFLLFLNPWEFGQITVKFLRIQVI